MMIGIYMTWGSIGTHIGSVDAQLVDALRQQAFFA
jgi:hypothetical protein